ncbi:MAG: EamA family transporter [Chitinophagaceae bacterium]|nr:MAG: EamA family transporter [Chitinophagaceae bacterium]
MSDVVKATPSRLMVILAFAVVYIVWGSTYYFIRLAIDEFPPFLMAAIRFVIAALLMFVWCAMQRETLFNWKDIKPAIISGLLMLGIGNGAVVWSEQYLASSLVAILVSAGPIWFVMLDKRNWSINLKSKSIIIGLLIGFIGVIVLFSENVMDAISGTGSLVQIIATGLLIIGSIAWAGGSLYSKYRTANSSNAVNTSWQMLSAGVAFSLISIFSGEAGSFNLATPTATGWAAIAYLIVFGSIIGYSSYVWLLSVRPATQVSTHSYVNPIVAVLLGVLFAGEQLSLLQISGLAIILFSVLLINLNKYLKPASVEAAKMASPPARQKTFQTEEVS